MSFQAHYCGVCHFPLFPIISNTVHEYCCLRRGCGNFKVSVSESETIRSIDPEVYWSRPDEQDDWSPAFEPDYWPHLDEHDDPSSSASHTTPDPGQLTEPGPSAVQQGPPPAAVNLAEASGDHSEAVKSEKKDDTPVLEKALSEMTFEGTDPIAEVTKWANRSAEQRQQEAKALGRFRRHLGPYNFYRKAYHPKVYKMVKENNLKKISAVLKQSWSMESESVRKTFDDLSNVDKDLSKQAFELHISALTT